MSSLAVLEHLFGEPDRLLEATIGELEELYARLLESFEAWTPPEGHDDQIRLLLQTRELRGFAPGCLPAASAAVTSGQLAGYLDQSEAWVVDRLRRRYAASLLYADVTIDLDPLSFFVHHRPVDNDWPMLVLGIGEAWLAMRRLRPLLERNCLELAPIPSPAETPSPPFEGEEHFNRGDPMFLWRDALVIANRANASLSDWSWAEARAASGGGSAMDQLDVRVQSALATVRLPLLTDIPIQTLADVHRDSRAISAWRADLRNASRLLTTSPNRAGLDADAQAVFSDVLVPRAAEVEREFATSRVLKDAVADSGYRVTFGAVAAGTAASLSALSPEQAVIGVGLGGATNLLATLLRRKRPHGSARVLSQLIRR